MAVSKRLRYEILRRDNHACRYCGATAPGVELTVDHVVAVSLGGSDDPSNLVAACRDCNAGKSSASADSRLVADVSQDAVRWAAAIKLATAQALESRDRQNEIEQAVYAVFEDTPVPSYKGGGTLAAWLPADWFQGLARYSVTLDRVELVDAAFIASAARIPPRAVWPYFCGICRNRVQERHEAAERLLTGTPDEPADDGSQLGPEECYAIHQYAELAAVCDGPAYESTD